MNKIEVDGNTYECNVDPSQMPLIERMLTGTTHSDTHIQSLSIPSRPIWLNVFVKVLRWYRYRISPKLGNRCVYEPSCSHYAELAFRKKWLYQRHYFNHQKALSVPPRKWRHRYALNQGDQYAIQNRSYWRRVFK